MGRRLPDYDPDHDGEYATSKRRIQLFKRVYQHYYRWCSLRETGEIDDIIRVDSEEIYLGDLMTGIDILPLRQRQAFELICLQGYTESAARDAIMPTSKWTTPVQQYSDDGLKKMVAAYDAKQDGTWDPTAARRKRRPKACEDTPKSQEFVAAPESGYSISSEHSNSAIDTDKPGRKSADSGVDDDA